MVQIKKQYWYDNFIRWVFMLPDKNEYEVISCICDSVRIILFYVWICCLFYLQVLSTIIYQLMIQSSYKLYTGLSCPVCSKGYHQKGVPVIVCSNKHQVCPDCSVTLSESKHCHCGQPLLQNFQQFKLSHSFYQSLFSQITKLQQKQARLTSNFNSNQHLRQCPQGHYLIAFRIQQKDSITQKHFCDICKKRLKEMTNIYWHCSICIYDKCAICAKPSSKKCPYGHPIYFRQFKQEEKQEKQEEKYYCDVCKMALKDSHKHCSCGYNLCFKCQSQGQQKIQKV